MARTVLPVVGAVIGFVVGGPVGAQIGFTIGNIAGNAVDPQVIKGPRIGDTQVQTSQEGVARPIVYGTAAVYGNVIDRGELEKVITRERQGKGGGPVVENERLYLTFAIRICEGPIDGVTRIWEDEKLVYDVRPSSTIVAESTAFAQQFTLYLGEESQLPDPDLEIIHGVGNTPAYRGSAYIVFKRKDVTDRRGSVPQYRFEVCRSVGVQSSSSDVASTGTWIAFAMPTIVSNVTQIYTVATNNPSDWTGTKRYLSASLPQTLECDLTGYGNGRLFACETGNIGMYRSDDLGETWAYASTTFSIARQERIDYQSGRVLLGRSSGFLYSDNGGVNFTAVSGTNFASRYVYGGANIVGSARTGVDVEISTNNGTSSGLVGSTTWGRAAGILLATDNYLLMLGKNNSSSSTDTNQFSRVPINTPTAAHTPFVVSAYRNTSSWGQTSPAAAYGNGIVVFINDQGDLAYSTDEGATWSVSQNFFPSQPKSVAFGDGKFVVVGFGGMVKVSTDGVNWTDATTNFGTHRVTNVIFVPGA